MIAMRRFALPLSLFALAACGERAAAPAGPTSEQRAEAGAASVVATPSTCLPWRNMFGERGPEWIQVARTRQGGFVQFRPRGVTRDLETCETFAQVRLLHREPQSWESPDGSVEVMYSKEVLDYRFRCQDQTFALTGRRFLGADDRVVQEAPIPFSNAPEDWRPVTQGGAAAIIQQPICKNG